MVAPREVFKGGITMHSEVYRQQQSAIWEFEEQDALKKELKGRIN